MKPTVRKVNGSWQVRRPGYGFGSDTVREFQTWKAALRSLRSSPGSAGSQVSFAGTYSPHRRWAERVGEAS